MREAVPQLVGNNFSIFLSLDMRDETGLQNLLTYRASHVSEGILSTLQATALIADGECSYDVRAELH